MSTWNFSYNNAPLTPVLQEKLQKYGVLRAVPETFIPNSAEVRFVKDFFGPDGFPKLADGVKPSQIAFPYIFPAIASWYDTASVPAVVVEMEPLYRQKACEAALSWVVNLTAAADPSSITDGSARSFDGLAFQETVGGTDHIFAFPSTCIRTGSHGIAAVIPVADTYWNNGEWEKQGSVPLYARQQAMFQLWCWQRYAEKSGYAVEAPETAFIVRICGNLAADCTIRTVEYNEAEANALVKRVCKARDLEPQKGLYWKRNIAPVQTWAEKVDNEAFKTNNDDLYELTVQYMKARSDRKGIELELKEVTDKMDAIGVKLASYIPAGNIQGSLELPDGTICTVTHQMKRTGSKRISPDLIRSFFPELDACIAATGAERTTVTIEVL